MGSDCFPKTPCGLFRDNHWGWAEMDFNWIIKLKTQNILPSPRQRVSEKNAMSGEKAGLRKIAMNAEWTKEGDFSTVKGGELPLS